MVLEATADTAAHLVLLVGLPLLLALFLLEGLIIGKILQPPLVFVTVVAVARPPLPFLALLCTGCVLSVVIGQWTIYRSFDPESTELVGIRNHLPVLGHLPTLVVRRVGAKRLRIVDRFFAKYGGISIFLSTFLPVVRGLIAIPAGVSSYPTNRFLAVCLASNALYFPLLAAAAFGIIRIFGL